MLELWNRTIRRAIDIRQGEGRSLFFSAAYYYLLLCAYYIIRPIRDDMGAAGGVDNLAWLFTGTLLGMLLMLVLMPLVELLTMFLLTALRVLDWRWFGDLMGLMLVRVMVMGLPGAALIRTAGATLPRGRMTRGVVA